MLGDATVVSKIHLSATQMPGNVPVDLVAKPNLQVTD